MTFITKRENAQLNFERCSDAKIVIIDELRNENIELKSQAEKMAVGFGKYLLKQGVKKYDDDNLWELREWLNLSGTHTKQHLFTNEELFDLYKLTVPTDIKK